MIDHPPLTDDQLDGMRHRAQRLASGLGRGKPGRREQPAHESLIRRATLAEVPLTGLSFEKLCAITRRCATERKGRDAPPGLISPRPKTSI